MAETKTSVIIGVDTHKRTHTVAAISVTGERLDYAVFDACADGYRQALKWAQSFGTVLRAGIESTGHYGAGLCFSLKASGIEVYDVYAPDKKRRRLHGKEDHEDAFQAAQAALSLTRCAVAKDKNEVIEAAVELENAYRLACRQRTACLNALKASIIKLPDHMRRRLEGKTDHDLIKTCSSLRAGTGNTGLPIGTVLALKHYARSVKSLGDDMKDLEREITRYAEAFAPNTLALAGIGCHGAITLLGVAGLNIDRMRNDAAFAMLCGVSPIPVSSGNRHHHRLNRGGNRRANSVLHIMAVTRIRLFPETRAFIDKKMSEGKSKSDGIRALKRYLARETLGALRADFALFGDDVK